MRKPIIAGNWKMNKTPCEAKELVESLKPLGCGAQCDVVVCVPAVNFAAVAEAAQGSNIRLGAQNMHWKESGAYTGELSAAMLRASGVEYVILGHSERRQYFAETDETVNLKTLAAVAAGLTPIVCVGETRAQREAGYTDALVAYQTRIALTGLTGEQVEKIVIAYEPVWAIGTGKTATAEQAQEIHAYIRTILREKFGAAADETPILYGGSCKPSNAPELFAKEDVDGGLIGGAALKAADFLAIGKGFPQK